MTSHSIGEEFLDLEIRISPCQDEGYPVEITLGSGQAFRGHLSADLVPWIPGPDPVEDGQRLFAALLVTGDLRSGWDEARGQSVQRRVRLHIDAGAPELHTLPWELLREGDVSLSASANTPFSRYLAVSKPLGDLVKERPIRVLIAISNPNDLEDEHRLASVDVDIEHTVLEDAFSGMDRDEVHLDFLAPPVTLEGVTEALQSGYHVLHYVGHGASNERRQQAVLYLQDEGSNARLVSDAALVEMLARQSPQTRPRMIFLAACQSAARSTADAFLGLGPHLVGTGVSAVVAMQGDIEIETARKLSRAFYCRLVEHGVVDCALNEARSLLLVDGRPDADVPVLFMRLRDGQLWKVKTEEDQLYALPSSEIEYQLSDRLARLLSAMVKVAKHSQEMSVLCWTDPSIEESGAFDYKIEDIGREYSMTVSCLKGNPLEDLRLAGFIERSRANVFLRPAAFEWFTHLSFSSNPIYYSEQLMSLVEHQRQRSYPVRYEFFIQSGDDQHIIVIHAKREDGLEDESPNPVLVYPNRDVLLLWSKAGYIKIVEGGINRGRGIFQLTRLAIDLMKMDMTNQQNWLPDPMRKRPDKISDV